MNSKIIAVDFDGCLVHNQYPEIGGAILKTIIALRDEQDAGAKIILWTCRQGQLLDKALNWCRNYGIRLSAVNENLPEIIEAFGGDTRKIYADEYWDDRAVKIP